MRRSVGIGALVTMLGALTGALFELHRQFERGDRSFRAEFDRLADEVLSAGPTDHTTDGLVTEGDLDELPPPLARFLRATGAVGEPRIASFTARLHGRIRGGPLEPWMPFTGEQVTRHGPVPSRLFRIRASMRGVPVDVFHSFIGPDATMRVRLLSMIPLVDAHGSEMNRSETVTIFNDMCVFAPAALLDAQVAWEPIDDRTVFGTFTRLGETVGATLHFDDHDRLVDFRSDDRYRSSRDGVSFSRQRWSTPIGGYRRHGHRVIATLGSALWHAEPPEGTFVYLEITIDDIEYNRHGSSGASPSRNDRPARSVQPTASRSTTNTSVSLGAITPPAPAAP